MILGDIIGSLSPPVESTDFFTADVQDENGPEAYDVFFGVHLATRKVEILGVTQHANEAYMTQALTRLRRKPSLGSSLIRFAA